MDYVRRKGDPHRVIKAMNEVISSALGDLTSGIRPQAASLGFANEALFDVARDLRFKLADAGLDPEEIRSSGLGYANLLYMATIVVELAKARDADLTMFLVEEPEAHLHPQLQMLVLEFLLEQAKKSSNQKIDPGLPEGRVQVLVTTHSPNLTAWVSPEHLVVVRSQNDETSTPRTRKTAVVAVQELGLPSAAIGKISRYLDVTRSALLFGSRALIVEGIAESLLIPAVARKIVLKDDPKAWLRFRGVILVPIGGVDFKPYLEILLRTSGGARIADRVVVVTDADPTAPGNRKAELEQFAFGLGASGNLRVLTNQRTLEHELFSSGNEALLRKTFLALHPNSEKDWVATIERASQAARPDAFLDLLGKKKTRKGDLAQEIASCIERGEPFVVPRYLKEAIKAISDP